MQLKLEFSDAFVLGVEEFVSIFEEVLTSSSIKACEDGIFESIFWAWFGKRRWIFDSRYWFLMLQRLVSAIIPVTLQILFDIVE